MNRTCHTFSSEAQDCRESESWPWIWVFGGSRSVGFIAVAFRSQSIPARCVRLVGLCLIKSLLWRGEKGYHSPCDTVCTEAMWDSDCPAHRLQETWLLIQYDSLTATFVIKRIMMEREAGKERSVAMHVKSICKNSVCIL